MNSVGISDLLHNFLGNDPLVGNAAMDYFSSTGVECLEIFLPSEGRPPEGSPQSDRRLAKLCRTFGQAAVPTLLRALRKGSWWTKMRAATCFDLYPFKFGDRVAGQIGNLLEESDFDVVNGAMLALGFMGAYSWAHQIIDVSDPERHRLTFEKAGGNALEALMLMVPRAPEEDIDGLLNLIERQFVALEKYAKNTLPHVALRHGAVRFGRLAADTLIRKWLQHDNRLFRHAALDALTAISLRRTAGAVAARLLDTSEDDQLRSSAARCLGEIGGDLAVETLERMLDALGNGPTIRGGVLWGMANLYAEASRPLTDDLVAEVLDSSSLEPKLHLIHALGFRRELSERLTSNLQNANSMIRGVSALSLARAKGVEAKHSLEIAYREASDDFERGLAGCALIACGESAFADDLHRVLCSYSSTRSVWLMQDRWKCEFLSALQSNGSQMYATAWSDVMRIDQRTCNQKLEQWGARCQGAMKAESKDEEAPATAVRSRDLIFVSYSHSDRVICEEFLKMIYPTAQRYGLRIWSDHQIKVGATWREEIDKALAGAKLGLLFVSPDFLQSKFIVQNELPPLLEAASKEGAKICWIACRYSNVEDTNIGQFQGVNSLNKPLAVLSRVAREKELKRISQEVMQMANS